MNDRMDVIAAVKSRDGSKSFWTRIGVAFPSKGGGWSIFLDYLPVARNDEGRIQMLMVEPRERDTGGSRGGGRSRKREDSESEDVMDDEIPFAWASLVPWIGALAAVGSMIA